MTKIQITINSEKREIPTNISVAELLKSLNLENMMVAVAKNSNVVPASHHATTHLSDGDAIEIIRAVSGG